MSRRGLVALCSVALLSACTTPYTAIEAENTATPLPKIPEEVEIPRYEGGWETDIGRLSLSQAVLKATEVAFSTTEQSAINPTLIFDGQLTPEIEECASKAFTGTLNVFGPYLTESFRSGSQYLVSGRGDWLTESVRNLPVEDWPVQNHFGTPVGFVDWVESNVRENSSSTTFGFSERNAVIISPGPGFSSNCSQISRLVYHETFHMVAMQLDGRSLMGFSLEEADHYGLWFVEGSADFFANTLSAHFLGEKYYGVDPDRSPGDLENHSSMFSSQSGQQYSLGNLAVEFIVGNVGVEPVMDVYRKIGEGHDFPAAFSLAIGMPIEDFYNLYDSIVISY